MRLWFARLFGTAANQMLMVAVGWQMYDLTGSAWDLGLVGLYQFVPALLLTLVAGHVADQYRRDRIVAACLSAQALVALALAAAAYEHWATRELLLGLSVALGAVRAFQMPAQQALTPLLVPGSMLARAMAFSSAGTQAAIIGGPAIGGVLFVAGAATVYAVCAALLAIGVVLLLRLGFVHVPPPRRPVTLDTLLSGVRFIWRAKLLLGAVSLDLFAVLLGGATALLPIYAKDILLTGPWGLGLLRAAPAVGALVMSVVLTRWPMQRKVGAKLLWAVALFGVCMVRVRAVDEPRAVDGGACGLGRRRHGQRGGAPDAGAARDARRHARQGRRGEFGLHRREQPVGRVRVGRHRRAARAGRLGAARRHRHADGGRVVVANLSHARAARQNDFLSDRMASRPCALTAPMRFDVVTLFPELFAPFTTTGVTRRAFDSGRLELRCWNPRDFAHGAYRRVDDRPFGGGPGMVMMAEPLARCVEAIRIDRGVDRAEGTAAAPVVLFSPVGSRIDHGVVADFADASEPGAILICGRYEGLDQRFIDTFVDRQLSLGDFVLSGGEIAAIALLDAVARLLPGVLNDPESHAFDSFNPAVQGLLDCPHYTRPERWRGQYVPDALLSGHHARIEQWRLEERHALTRRVRPDLLPPEPPTASKRQKL